MKKTILISLLAFMIMPLMAQNTNLGNYDLFETDVKEMGKKFVLVDRETGDIVRRYHEVFIEVDEDGTGYLHDPFLAVFKSIKIIYPETSGELTPRIIDQTTGEDITTPHQCSCKCWCCMTTTIISFSVCQTCETDCSGCGVSKCGKQFGGCTKCWDGEDMESCSCRYIVVE